MSERITKQALASKFNQWCKAVGGRPATSWDDVGGYRLASNSPGDGITRYTIEQIMSKGGGVSTLTGLRSWLGSREAYYMMDTAIDSIYELERNTTQPQEA